MTAREMTEWRAYFRLLEEDGVKEDLTERARSALAARLAARSTH